MATAQVYSVPSFQFAMETSQESESLASVLVSRPIHEPCDVRIAGVFVDSHRVGQRWMPKDQALGRERVTRLHKHYVLAAQDAVVYLLGELHPLGICPPVPRRSAKSADASGIEAFFRRTPHNAAAGYVAYRVHVDAMYLSPLSMFPELHAGDRGTAAATPKPKSRDG